MYTEQKQGIAFIRRTKKLLAQYEKFQLDEKKKYEVTLLLNCFVGLVMLPRQQYDDLPEVIISPEKWGISPGDIVKGEKDVKNVVRHLRNSVAHIRFEMLGTSGKIDMVKFTDKDDTGINFETTIFVPNLQKFAKELADYVLFKMEKQKPATPEA